MTLYDYTMKHAVRGECTCGECLDKVLDAGKKQPIGHTIDMGFFLVSARNDPKRQEIADLIRSHKGEFGPCDLYDGRPHDFIEVGAWLGDQSDAMVFMGMGASLKMWEVLLVPDHGPVIQVPCPKIYVGERKDGGAAHITRMSANDKGVDSVVLDPAPSLKVANHSPGGFEWGYEGSGPAQLALAILMDFGVNVSDAVRLHQAFKHDVVAAFKKEKWFLLGSRISEWLHAHGQ